MTQNNQQAEIETLNQHLSLVRSVQKLTRAAIIVGIIVILTVGAVVAGYFRDRASTNEIRLQACENTEIIKATLSEDAQRQLATSERYLKEHPRGAPGIPAKVIKEDISNRKLTLKKLAPTKVGTATGVMACRRLF